MAGGVKIAGVERGRYVEEEDQKLKDAGKEGVELSPLQSAVNEFERHANGCPACQRGITCATGMRLLTIRSEDSKKPKGQNP